MAKKIISRPDSFSDYDAEEDTSAPSVRPYMPMDEANGVYDRGLAGLPMERHISPRVLLEQEKERNQQLEAELAQAKSAGQILAADGTIKVYDFQLTPAGLIAPEQASFEAWEQVGHLLFRLEGSIQWLIGDWLLYGEQVQWGETRAIAEALGREPQTLYHYKSLCLTFEFCRRRQNLSFGHHDAVRGLTVEAQDQALDYAESYQPVLSVAKFRQWIAEQKKLPLSPALPPSESHVLRPIMSEFKRLVQRDRIQAEEYVSKLELAVAEMRAQLKAGNNL